MQKKHFLLICYIIASFGLRAQQELGLNFMRDTWQSNGVNPAFAPKANGHFSLPSYYLGSFNTFGLPRVLRGVVQPSVWVNQLKETSTLALDAKMDVASFGFRYQKFYFSFNYGLHYDILFRAPKGLFNFATFGNAPYIGQTLQLGPRFDLSLYAQTSLGAAYQLDDKLSLGARLKFCRGFTNIATPKSQIALTTNPDIYQLTIATDYQINSANFDLSNLDANFNTNGFNQNSITNVAEFFKSAPGRGFGIDLGADYKLNDQINLSASIVNLGVINWSKKLTAKGVKDTYTLDGFDVKKIFKGDSINFNNLSNSSIKDYIKDTPITSYTTSLPSTFNVSGQYKLNKYWRFGALVSVLNHHGSVQPVAAIGANLDLSDVFSLGTTYSMRKRNPVNIGLNAALRLGFVQGFINFDNVLGVANPSFFGNFNGRAGVNLLFGRKAAKKVHKPIIKT